MSCEFEAPPSNLDLQEQQLHTPLQLRHSEVHDVPYCTHSCLHVDTAIVQHGLLLVIILKQME